MNLSGGKWWNPYGYKRTDTGRRECGRAVFEFLLDPLYPMTLQIGENVFVQPDRHGYSNGGNVPWIVQPIVPPDLHWPSWIIHDRACQTHTLFFADSLHGIFRERSVSSRYAAEMMGIGLYAAGFTDRAYWAYHGVRLFGPRWKV